MLGTVGGGSLALRCGETAIDLTLDELRAAHGALAPLFP